MSGILEEEFSVNAEDFERPMTSDDPLFDPLGDAGDDKCSMNNNSFDVEDIELSITGSVIKTKHLSVSSDDFIVVDAKTLKPLTDTTENLDLSSKHEAIPLEEAEIENVNVKEESAQLEVDFEDLEELIECEKIEVKKLISKMDIKSESDLEDEPFEEPEVPKPEHEASIEKVKGENETLPVEIKQEESGGDSSLPSEMKKEEPEDVLSLPSELKKEEPEEVLSLPSEVKKEESKEAQILASELKKEEPEEISHLTSELKEEPILPSELKKEEPEEALVLSSEVKTEDPQNEVPQPVVEATTQAEPLTPEEKSLESALTTPTSPATNQKEEQEEVLELPSASAEESPEKPEIPIEEKSQTTEPISSEGADFPVLFKPEEQPIGAEESFSTPAKTASEAPSGVSATSTPNASTDVAMMDEITEGEEATCGEEELRSDGSDSGLGSEPSHNSSTLLHETINPKASPSSSPSVSKSALRPGKSSLKRRSNEPLESASTDCKRRKRNIQFEGVTVYYFPRQQGFSCVPSQGGCSLGMSNSHNHIRQYTLSEHSAEQRKQHRLQLAEMNPRSSSSEETDSEDEPTESSSDADSETYGFLQPVSAKQRRILLKAAGVRKIDATEKDECRSIRTSREVCGCTCRVYCDPETCACSQGGIKCQVDRQNFPCGCTRDGCGNVVGRVEFNPVRVRTHYIHTVMRLEMEKKQEKMAIVEYHPPPQPQEASQWRVPTPNMSICDFNLLYSGQNADRRPAPESLDLHYAYRDEYSASSVATTPPYQATSIYDPSCSFAEAPPIAYDTGHFAPLHSFPQAPDPRVQGASYEQYPAPFFEKPLETPPVMSIEPVPSNSYINLGAPVSNPARVDALNSLLDNNRSTALPQPQAVDENLGEIIKKSIVETVSAV